MANYVQSNAKYYKGSKASGEIGHIQRAFADNKNSVDELKQYNFSSTNDLHTAYKQAFNQAAKKRPELGLPEANAYLDTVVSFSRGQVRELIEKHGWEKVQKGIERRLNSFMEEIEEKQGFKAVGWGFHADEGHKDPLTGEWKENYHAHVVFLNYDEKTNKMPLRRKKKADWEQFQDIVAGCFQKMGFKRGINKELTQAEHLEKDEFIAQKQNRILQENNLLKKFYSQMEKLIGYFEANNEKRLKSTENRIQKTVD